MSTLSLLNIINWIDELALYITPDYEIVAMNAAAASFFACDESTSIGKNALQVFSENKQAIPIDEIKEVRKTGQPAAVKMNGVCWQLLPAEQAPNQKVMLLGKYQESVHQQEDMTFFIKQVKEITGQDVKKNLSLPSYANIIKHYYERLIDHMPHNVYWLDKNCVTLGCNQNVLRLIGLTKKEHFVGITYEDMGKLADWTHGQAESFKRDDMEVMRTNQSKHNVEEPILYDENNEPIYYLSSRVPLHDDKGEVIGVIGISVDVTDKIKAQELAKQNEISEKIIQTLKTITGSLSHEIRTPLSGIRLGLQTFKHFLTKLFEERKQLVAIKEIQDQLCFTSDDIKETARHINKLTEKIDEGNALINLQLKNMSLEHIDTNAFESCDIKSCIESAIQDFPFKYAHEREWIHLDMPDTFNFWGDALLTRHTIWNLLSNALHFIREESKGVITITAEKTENMHLVHIQDTARGMSPEEMARVFEQFYTRRKDGTGLGLSFCKLVMKGKRLMNRLLIRKDQVRYSSHVIQ